MIIEELYPVLFQLEPSGDFQKKVGSEMIENFQIKDLEYGDLLYQKKRAKDRDIKLSRRQTKAFDICWKTKVVRDAIAHTRMPSLMSIQDLVLSMEDFCAPSNQ